MQIFTGVACLHIRMNGFMQATPGITEPHLSRDPLGTEGEMTSGPDAESPFDRFNQSATAKVDPTEGNDPYLFDNVGEELEGGISLPPIGDGPRF